MDARFTERPAYYVSYSIESKLSERVSYVEDKLVIIPKSNIDDIVGHSLGNVEETAQRLVAKYGIGLGDARTIAEHASKTATQVWSARREHGDG